MKLLFDKAHGLVKVVFVFKVSYNFEEIFFVSMAFPQLSTFQQDFIPHQGFQMSISDTAYTTIRRYLF